MSKDVLQESSSSSEKKHNSSKENKRWRIRVGPQFDRSEWQQSLGDRTWELLKIIRHPAEAVQLAFKLFLGNNDIKKRQFVIQESQSA